MRGFYLVLFLFFYYLHECVSQNDTVFVPLSVSVLRPYGERIFSKQIEKSLVEAIENLRTIVNVNREDNEFVPSTKIQHCAGVWKKSQKKRKGTLMDFTGALTHLDIVHGLTLNDSNFVLIVDTDTSKCNVDKSLLASAKPCYIKGGRRPLAGLLVVCPETNGRWKGFKATVDLFRHEILHALGYGTITPSKNPEYKAPADSVIKWRVGKASHSLKRTFMDFGSNALNTVQNHFGCDSLEGIESEDTKRMHLNEYIFGNELMTPVLSSHKNLFTEISASILETTRFGKIQWYSVNRSSIAVEHSQYWYGRRWGCDFVEKSCGEYIKNMKRLKKSTFPFCSAKEYTKERDLTVCLNTDDNRCKRKFQCGRAKLNKLMSTGPLDPISLRSMFPKLDRKWKSVAGSSEVFRFCPFIQDISEDNMIDFSANVTVSLC